MEQSRTAQPLLGQSGLHESHIGRSCSTERSWISPIIPIRSIQCGSVHSVVEGIKEASNLSRKDTAMDC